MATLINHWTKNISFTFPKHGCSELKIQLCHGFCICYFPFPTRNLGVPVSGNYSCRGPGTSLVFPGILLPDCRFSHHFQYIQVHVFNLQQRTLLFCTSVLGAGDFTGTRWSLCNKRFIPVDNIMFERQIKDAQILATKEVGPGREQMKAVLVRLFWLGKI